VKVGFALDPEIVTFDAKGGGVTPTREPVVTDAVSGAPADPTGLLNVKVQGPARSGLYVMLRSN
jgi:hypothetical protein